MLNNTKTYWMFLSFVTVISFSWSLSFWNLEDNFSNLTNGIGFGLSIDSRLQNLLLSNYPKIFNLLNIFCFPILGFIISYLIFNKFLNQIWSIFLAFVFFSNVYGYPFHEFIFSSDDYLNLKQKELIKYSTFSLIISLVCVNLILSASFIYKTHNYVLLITTILLVFLNAMDAIGVSIVYCVCTFIRFIKHKSSFNEMSMILLLIFSWVINLLLGVIPQDFTSDAKNTLNYSILYFFLPVLLTTLAYFILRIDIYQLIRRFSGLAIVMMSEIFVILIHYFAIFELSILELQFLSVYNMFHILYYVPFIFWICNSRDLLSDKIVKNKILSLVPNNSFTFYLPLFGIFIIVIFNLKLLLIRYSLILFT